MFACFTFVSSVKDWIYSKQLVLIHSTVVDYLLHHPKREGSSPPPGPPPPAPGTGRENSKKDRQMSAIAGRL
jgi:hypothetical protein